MEIQVRAIQFSRITNGPVADALRLRKNALEILPFPEWQRGVSGRSLTAYAVEDVQLSPAPVNILVRFRISGSINFPSAIRIRAVEPDLPSNGSLLELMLNAHVNVLGEVNETEVMLTQAGETDWLRFRLQNLRVATWGVGTYQVIWKWQWFNASFGNWLDFDITSHQVYVVLRKPTAPWSQNSNGDLQLPWTDVLDHACSWAARSFSVDEAAAKITARIFNMGPVWFEYNCINFLPAYVQMIGYTGRSYFNCMAFLQHLKMRNVNRFVICSDCATIVSTFSNILGCNLWQSTLQTPGTTFRVNRILAIGARTWQRPCGLQGFTYHEVAWGGEGTAADPVYDACLAIDGTSDPDDLLSVPVLPANILLGSPGSGLYRDKLVFAADRMLAEARPETRERRMPFPAPSTIGFPFTSSATPGPEEERIKQTKRSLHFGDWKNRNQLPGSQFVQDFSVDEKRYPLWEIQVMEELEATQMGPRYLHTIWRSRRFLGEAMRIDFYECTSQLKAQDFLVRLLSNVHTTIDVMRTVPDLGDIAFSSSSGRHVSFARANMVVNVARSGVFDVPLMEAAHSVDEDIISAGSPRR